MLFLFLSMLFVFLSMSATTAGLLLKTATCRLEEVAIFVSMSWNIIIFMDSMKMMMFPVMVITC